MTVSKTNSDTGTSTTTTTTQSGDPPPNGSCYETFRTYGPGVIYISCGAVIEEQYGSTDTTSGSYHTQVYVAM